MEKAGIDLRRLRYFIAVCEHGGFSRASSSIGVAQPALTRQIKLLEKEIGLPLFNRTGRGAEPTDEGRYLLARSREHLEGLDGLMRELRQRSSAPSGHVVLGICPTIAPIFLDDLLHFARESHPNLTVSVIEAYGGDLDTMMRRDEIDLALTYNPQKPNDVDVTDLFSERLAVVTSGEVRGDPGPRTLPEIAAMRLVLPTRIHALRGIIEGVSRRRGLMLEPELELDSLEAVKALIGRPRQYATILPFCSVRREVELGQLSCFAIDDADMRRTVAVVVPRHAPAVPGAAILVEHIRWRSSHLKSRIDTLF